MSCAALIYSWWEGSAGEGRGMLMRTGWSESNGALD